MQIDFASLSHSRLADMARAGDEVLEAFRVLGKAGTNAVAQVLKHHGTFYEMDHYPPGDVYDDESGAQYYYHAHRAETGEHGHFHTFVRAKAIPDSIAPYPDPHAGTSDAERPLGEDAICHLIAVSMDKDGLPISLFTTNRWVTGETLYKAKDTIALLDHFSIDHVDPCLATNHWLTAMLRLFRPQIEKLLVARDERIQSLQAARPDADVFEDRDVEITSEVDIDIDAQIALVNGALAPHTGHGLTHEGVDSSEGRQSAMSI